MIFLINILLREYHISNAFFHVCYDQMQNTAYNGTERI